MVLEAIKFMFLGMGIVFLFLTLMIYVLQWQTNFLKRFEHKHKKQKNSTQNNVTNIKVAAITAALYQHTKNKGQ